MLIEGVYSLLTTCAPLTAIVGSRVTAVVLPKNPVFPAVTFLGISGRTDVALDQSAISDSRIEVNVWSKSYLTAAAGQQALHDLFDGYSGTLSDGTRVIGTTSSDNPDFYESDSLLFRCSSDFTFSN